MTLREARQHRGLTQEALASASGVEQTTISNIETGRVQSPAWDTVARLCRALDMDPRDIFPISLEKEAS